jgi:hypothetical protein
MPKVTRMLELKSQIKDLPTLNLINEINSRSRSVYIFKKNHKELTEALDLIESDPEGIVMDYRRNPDLLYKMLAEVARTTHNFIASALTLVEHTRNVFKKLYKETGKFKDYQSRVNSDFKDDSLSQFIQGLRQYFLHYKLPDLLTRSEEIIGEKEVKISVNLIKEDLLAFDGWNPQAKEFIRSFESNINILSIINEYKEKVVEFHGWFTKRQEEIHLKEFDNFKQLNNEYIGLYLENKIKELLERGLSNYERDDVFIGIFLEGEFRELDKIQKLSSDKVTTVISMLEKYIPVSEDLKKTIHQWYRLSNN